MVSHWAVSLKLEPSLDITLGIVNAEAGQSDVALILMHEAQIYKLQK